MIQPCDKCGGTGKNSTPCKKCKHTGVIKESVTSEIRIPIGIREGNVIRVQGAGNFNHSIPMVQDVYGEIYIHIKVKKDPDMELAEESLDILSKVEIDLLEALKGCEREVRTIKGNIRLKIPAGIRNMEQRKVGGYGAGGQGDHIFTIFVNYPKDYSGIIKCLEEKTN